MKLYHDPAAAIDERWQLPGKQSKAAARADVPDRPLELAAWLNDRRVPATPDTEIADQLEALEALTPLNEEAAELLAETKQTLRDKVPGFCGACGRSAAGSLKLARGNDLTALSDWLEELDQGDLWAMERAAVLIRDRARALGAEFEGRIVQ